LHPTLPREIGIGIGIAIGIAVHGSPVVVPIGIIAGGPIRIIVPIGIAEAQAKKEVEVIVAMMELIVTMMEVKVPVKVPVKVIEALMRRAEALMR